ncbi:MAG: hypothetical protein WBE72_01450 [Terracidiphilus sp.]
MASATQPRIRANRALKLKAKPSKDSALREIAAIIEKHMTDEGLSEKEKNTKVKLFASLVDKEISERKRQSATPSKRRRTAGSRA